MAALVSGDHIVTYLGPLHQVIFFDYTVDICFPYFTTVLIFLHLNLGNGHTQVQEDQNSC